MTPKTLTMCQLCLPTNIGITVRHKEMNVGAGSIDVDAAELEENDEREESQESAVEGLLLLQRSCKVDVQTQTPPPVRESPGAQSSVLFYHANNLLSSSRIRFYKALWQEASRRQ